MLTGEQFIKHLRGALNHLYDPDYLRRSPLAMLFDVADRFEAPASLQRILTKAIVSFEPGDDEPPESHAWWIYDSLFCCYVQQLSQQEVADQLGISTRHLRRKQRAALEALAHKLWKQFDLEAKLRRGTDGAIAPERVALDGPAVDDELAWLKEAPPAVPTHLGQVLLAVHGRARPLADRHGVDLEITAADGLPDVAVHTVALSQTLLNLIGTAIHRATGAKVHISARPTGQDVQIRVWGAQSPPGVQPLADDDAASLQLARQLVDLCDGELALSIDGEAFSATLTIPALEQLPVLIIDDNADTLQLMQRYTQETRYRLVGTRDPEQALSMAERLFPEIVVLDVMMPQVDGWEVLARLRQHPLTCHLPIIVCTILAQEDLALSLGASAFLRKPITRQAFLAALDYQMMESESRSGPGYRSTDQRSTAHHPG